MKISVIGSGLIGSLVIQRLTAARHDTTGRSRSTGLDLLTSSRRWVIASTTLDA